MRKTWTIVKGTLAAAVAVLALLLVPWEACFGAELAGEPVEWVTSMMRVDEFSVEPSASATEPASTEKAALHLMAVNLPETKQRPGSLEISLQAAAGSSFKTAGILLEYDYSKLRPIAWDKEQTPIEIPNVAGTPLETDLEGAWRNAAVLETKSPGDISAKPALSFRNGNRAYLYMAAERQTGGPLEKDTLAVTARFVYALGATPSKDYVASALNFVENRAGMKVAYASPVKGSVLYQSEDPEMGEAGFYYHKSLEKTETGLVREAEGVPADQKLDRSINVFTYVESGRSVSERAAQTKDFVSLTFYDWDDTLLGTRIVAKETGWLIDPNLPENRSDYVNADGTAKYTDAELAAMNVAPLAPEGNVLTGGLDQNGVTVTAINKAGYRYAGWVDYSGTSTPDVGIQAAAGQTITGNGQELVGLAGLTESRVLRAAYDEAVIAGIEDEADWRYRVAAGPFHLDKSGSYLETEIMIWRTETTRRQECDKRLAIRLRPYGLGETLVLIDVPIGDLSVQKIIMPLEAASTYSKTNAISFFLEDKKGNLISNTVKVPAGDIDDKSNNAQ